MADKYVGRRVKRTEDPRLIKGLAHYVDDVGLPGTLHVAFVRSMYAHARITGVDTSEAMKAPGVVAVYTGKDVATKVGPVPCAAALPDLKVPDYRVLATDKVLFVGHPIAAVVATDKYAARDAVELISVDYEELPVVVDVEKAAWTADTTIPIGREPHKISTLQKIIAEFETGQTEQWDPKRHPWFENHKEQIYQAKNAGYVIHESFDDNIAYKLTSGEGDIDAAMKSADKIVS